MQVPESVNRFSDEIHPVLLFGGGGAMPVCWNQRQDAAATLQAGGLKRKRAPFGALGIETDPGGISSAATS